MLQSLNQFFFLSQAFFHRLASRKRHPPARKGVLAAVISEASSSRAPSWPCISRQPRPKRPSHGCRCVARKWSRQAGARPKWRRQPVFLVFFRALLSNRKQRSETVKRKGRPGLKREGGSAPACWPTWHRRAPAAPRRQRTSPRTAGAAAGAARRLQGPAPHIRLHSSTHHPRVQRPRKRVKTALLPSKPNIQTA